MGEKIKIYFEKNGNALIVRPNGRLDSATAPELSDEISEKLDGVDEIVMDLARVDFISSAGLRTFLEILEKMTDVNGRIKLIHVNDSIREVLEITGFLDFVTMEETAAPDLPDGICE